MGKKKNISKMVIFKVVAKGVDCLREMVVMREMTVEKDRTMKQNKNEKNGSVRDRNFVAAWSPIS